MVKSVNIAIINILLLISLPHHMKILGTEFLNGKISSAGILQFIIFFLNSLSAWIFVKKDRFAAEIFDIHITHIYIYIYHIWVCSEIKLKQAGAELCQAQIPLKLVLGLD